MAATELTRQEPSESWADLAAIDIDDGRESPQAAGMRRLISEGRVIRHHRIFPTRRTTYQWQTPAGERVEMVVRRGPILQRAGKWLAQRTRQIAGRSYMTNVRDHVTTRTTYRTIQ